MAGLTDNGEEFIQKYVWTDGVSRPASFTVGLYNEASDTIGEADDMAQITTEPSGGSYAAQSINFGSGSMTASQVSGDWAIDIADVTFDVSDSSESVDAYYISANVQLAGDGSATEHLLLTGALDQSYNLGYYTSFTIQDSGVSLS